MTATITFRVKSPNATNMLDACFVNCDSYMLNFFFLSCFWWFFYFFVNAEIWHTTMEPKYSPLFTDLEISPTSVSYFSPQVPIYWIAFVFWLFSQKLLIFFSFRNLSHNLLSGPIGNVFTGLQNLREMYVFFTWSLYFLYPDVWSEKKIMHSTTLHEM